MPRAGGGADRRRHPDRRGRRQALDVVFFSTFEDGAGADKADAGSNALEGARSVSDIGAAFNGDEHERRAAEGDRHVGPKTGCFAHYLPLEADQAAEQSGRPEPNGDTNQVVRVGGAEYLIHKSHPTTQPPRRGGPRVSFRRGPRARARRRRHYRNSVRRPEGG